MTTKTVKYFIHIEAINRADLNSTKDISNRVRSNASKTAVISAAKSYINYRNQTKGQHEYEVKLTKIWREIAITETYNYNLS